MEHRSSTGQEAPAKRTHRFEREIGIDADGIARLCDGVAGKRGLAEDMTVDRPVRSGNRGGAVVPGGQEVEREEPVAICGCGIGAGRACYSCRAQTVQE